MIKLGRERFEAPEAMFNPSLIDVEGKGVADMVYEMIQYDADMDCRSEYYKHIVLSGGSSMYPGLPSRLEKDIQDRYLKEILKGDETKLKKFKVGASEVEWNEQRSRLTHGDICDDPNAPPIHPESDSDPATGDRRVPTRQRRASARARRRVCVCVCVWRRRRRRGCSRATTRPPYVLPTPLYPPASPASSSAPRPRLGEMRIEDPPRRKHLVFLGGTVLADIMKEREEFWMTKVKGDRRRGGGRFCLFVRWVWFHHGRSGGRRATVQVGRR